METRTRRLVVRLNAGDMPIFYDQRANGSRLVVDWWVEAHYGEDVRLDVVERLIIEALIYADAR